MEGLEATEIPWSSLNAEVRYEAEFFQKKYLREDTYLAKFPEQSIGNFAYVTDGPHGYHIVDESSPIAMLTAKCAKDWFTDRSSAETITESVNLANRRSMLEKNDIILSTRGTVGMCALVTKEALPANIDQDVARISWLDKQSIRPEFVIAYLNSKFGQDHIRRYSSGMVQQGLSLQKVREIPIPLLSDRVQGALAIAVQSALKSRREASLKSDEAESILRRALGVEKWQAPEPLTYVRNSSAVFAAGRLDAQYFQPEKAAALEILAAASDSVIGNYYESIRDLWQPDNGQPDEQVRNYDLSDALVPFLDGNKELAERGTIASTKKKIEEGDLVVSRLRSYLKEIAIVQSSADVPMVASTEFIVLRPRQANPLPIEALLIYLRSHLPQLIFKWSQDGSNHPRFDEKELLKLPVPRVVVEQADQYVEIVNAMVTAREKSAQLIDAAKRAVEIAIEQDEAAGLAYLAAQSALSPGVQPSASTAGYLQ